MATIYYFRSTTPSEPKPNVRQGTWSLSQFTLDNNGGNFDTIVVAYPCSLSTTPGSSVYNSGATLVEPGTNHYGHCKLFISPALAAQTIEGTITISMDFQEGNAAQNMMPMVYIYVWKADDSGRRGDLLGTNAGANISATEANTTSGTLQTFHSAVAISSLAISAGDRTYTAAFMVTASPGIP